MSSMTAAPSLPRSVAGARARLRVRPELAGLLLLAAVLNLWGLARNGWANEYYSAAVHSMASSWHAFLYGSFDASSVMTVDKPPLALWVQALSVRAFGFHPLSILVPEALMGMATVALAYDLTRRRFGRAAGFAAGLALATTPITVALSRHNNPDALLILCATAALWFLVRGLEDGRLRWLLLCAAAVGLGFEAKMAVALMVVPGIAAAWLWVAPRGRRVALGQLAAGGGVLAAVGLAWPVLVWLTPAADRPWVSGTSDNSIWSLILDYNGFGRLTGQAGGPGGAGSPGGGPGGVFGGDTGVLRLLDASLGGQAGWLLGFALVAAVAVAVATRLRRDDPRTGWIIAVGGAFATTAIAFSTAKGIFHPYYVSFLAPFTAALVGAGVGLALRRDRIALIAGPAAILGGVVTELLVLHNQSGVLTWLPPLLVGLGIPAAALLATELPARARAAIVAGALGLLLLAPATWAAQTLGHATSGTFPAGGPQTQGMGFGGPGGGFGGPPGGGAFAGGAGGAGLGGPMGGSTGSLSQVVSYVESHGGGSIAVSSQNAAGAQILATKADVVALGGFSGRESQVSVSWLAQAVRSGKVRWVIADSGGGPMDSRVGSRDIMSLIAQTCPSVTVGGTTLYDCAGQASALLAAAGQGQG